MAKLKRNNASMQGKSIPRYKEVAVMMLMMMMMKLCTSLGSGDWGIYRLIFILIWQKGPK